ncbi:hypothetical protein PR048_018937 [Dryococelus australis]|uniref:Uncharacterized protein n=1 Tax=Dryococelus australis TaxID=614101 RepID=A0ABQ9H258_9NEOP|nr:hypothetical protein PR048_018937 [Dryococelus australis]
MKERVKRKIPEKTSRPAASTGTIVACKNPGVTRTGMEPKVGIALFGGRNGTPRWSQLYSQSRHGGEMYEVYSSPPPGAATQLEGPASLQQRLINLGNSLPKFNPLSGLFALERGAIPRLRNEPGGGINCQELGAERCIREDAMARHSSFRDTYKSSSRLADVVWKAFPIWRWQVIIPSALQLAMVWRHVSDTAAASELKICLIEGTDYKSANLPLSYGGRVSISYHLSYHAKLAVLEENTCVIVALRNRITKRDVRAYEISTPTDDPHPLNHILCMLTPPLPGFSSSQARIKINDSAPIKSAPAAHATSDDFMDHLYTTSSQKKKFLSPRSFTIPSRWDTFSGILASHQDELGAILGRVTPEFHKCRTKPLVGGFSLRSPVSPAPPFQSCSMITHFTLVGSQDLDPLVQTVFDISWRDMAQPSPSTGTADDQCTDDIDIFMHKTVEPSQQIIELQVLIKRSEESWKALNIEVLEPMRVSEG